MTDFRYVVDQEYAGLWYVLKFMRCENDFKGKPLWSLCLGGHDRRNGHKSKNSAILDFLIKNGVRDLYEIKRPNEMTAYELKEACEVPIASVPDTWLKKV